MGSEADGGRAERAVQEGAGAGAMVLGAPGGPGEPREPGAPGEPEGLGEPGGRGAEGAAGAASGGGSQVEQAPHGPGPDGDAAPAAGRPGRRRLQFVLTVPFPSPMEAEIAERFLTPNAELPGPVRKELSVNGSFLTVRLTAEDPGQLQMSVASCLDQVSMVIRTIWRIGPPFFAQPQQENGG